MFRRCNRTESAIPILGTLAWQQNFLTKGIAGFFTLEHRKENLIMFPNYKDYIQKNASSQQIDKKEQVELTEQFQRDCIVKLAKEFANAGIRYTDVEMILLRTLKTIQVRVLVAPVPDGNVIATELSLESPRIERWASRIEVRN
jgi:hypothetical protein